MAEKGEESDSDSDWDGEDITDEELDKAHRELEELL